MKKIENLKINEIEKDLLPLITGGQRPVGATINIKAGTVGSWSWSAGHYTSDCNTTLWFADDCKTDYSGRIYYDGAQLQ